MRKYIVSRNMAGAYETLSEALRAVKMEESTFREKESVQIVIHGMQYLSETIYITDEHLPEAEHRVCVVGADERSGFSGGIIVSGFSHWKDNIWRTSVTDIDNISKLFIDGKSAKCLTNKNFLTNPLEYYFDPQEKMLYIVLENEVHPEEYEIVIPRLEKLLVVKGDLERRFCCIRFQNLYFSHTTLSSSRMCEEEYQCNKVTSALSIIAAKDTSFKECTFTALGTDALQYGYGSQLCRVTGNHFYEIDGTALCIGEHYQMHFQCLIEETVRWIEVSDNLIHNIGLGTNGIAIMIGNAREITFKRNEIHDKE